MLFVILLANQKDQWAFLKGPYSDLADATARARKFSDEDGWEFVSLRELGGEIVKLEREEER